MATNYSVGGSSPSLSEKKLFVLSVFGVPFYFIKVPLLNLVCCAKEKFNDNLNYSILFYLVRYIELDTLRY